jgi:hypothetical protein
MHRAGAALRHAASIFCSRQLKLFADHPKQRGRRINVEIDAFAVNRKTNHCSSPDFYTVSIE